MEHGLFVDDLASSIQPQSARHRRGKPPLEMPSCHDTNEGCEPRAIEDHLNPTGNAGETSFWAEHLNQLRFLAKGNFYDP